MGLKSLANRNKGKRPVVEEDDSDFALPLSKRGQAPPKKKSKVAAHEKIPQDDAQKNDQDGVGLRYQIKNIHPTDEERPKLQLEGLFLDESIDDRGTTKQIFESGSSSKKSDLEDIELLKSKLELVIFNQESLAEDFILLRCFVKSSDELVTQDSNDDDDDVDDDEDDDKGLPNPENIDSDFDDGDELGKDGGDVVVVDKVVCDEPTDDVNQTEAVAGSEEGAEDDENVKDKESTLKGDDFFDSLSQLEIDDEQVALASLEVVGKINVPESNPSVAVEKAVVIPSDE
ncbi:hypothetical protein CsatB_003221 [Cannabis sativa]